MGVLLLIVGLGWAFLGVGNFWSLASQQPPPNSTLLGFSMIFQGGIFVIPGLFLAGMGQSLREKTIIGNKTITKKEHIEIDSDIKKCPYCAENINKEAKIDKQI